MRLEELSLTHMIPFIAMIKDFHESDPHGLKKLFPNQQNWDGGEFRNFIKTCEKERLDWKPGPNRISRTRYVLLDDENQITGFAELRFPLDQKSEIEGGNVSFITPPSKRGAMWEAHTLNKMLFEAVRAGMARILVTCYEEDEVSRQAIEMNRGELENTVPGVTNETHMVRRYWIRLR